MKAEISLRIFEPVYQRSTRKLEVLVDRRLASYASTSFVVVIQSYLWQVSRDGVSVSEITGTQLAITTSSTSTLHWVFEITVLVRF